MFRNLFVMDGGTVGEFCSTVCLRKNLIDTSICVDAEDIKETSYVFCLKLLQPWISL